MNDKGYSLRLRQDAPDALRPLQGTRQCADSLGLRLQECVEPDPGNGNWQQRIDSARSIWNQRNGNASLQEEAQYDNLACLVRE